MEACHDNLDDATWREYRDALHRFIMRRVDDADAAEDIVQDVLVRAYTQRETLKEPSRLRAWLYQITRNAIVDHYRSRKPLEAIPDDLVQETAEDEEGRATRELASCLVPLLDTLPEPYRKALRLAELEGVRQREVAASLGLSLSGAKSRVQRARRMLRDALMKCCRVELDHRGSAVDYEIGDGCDACSTPGET